MSESYSYTYSMASFTFIVIEKKTIKLLSCKNTYTPCVDTSNVNGSPILGIRGPFVGLHDVVPLTCTVFYQCHQNGLFEELGNSKISIQYLAYITMPGK